MNKCQKCEKEFEGNFCSNCGESIEQPAQQPAPQVVIQQPPKKKRHPVLIVIGCLACIGIIGAIFGDKGNNIPAGTNSAGSQNQASAGSVNTVSESEETKYGIGQPAEQKDIKITLDSVSESVGSEFNKPTDGNVFVICEYTIENNSEKDLAVSSLLCFDAYCDDYSISFSLSATIAAEGKSTLDGTAAPGKKMNGIVAYEVPTDWEEIEMHCALDVFSSSKIIFSATK